MSQDSFDVRPASREQLLRFLDRGIAREAAGDGGGWGMKPLEPFGLPDVVCPPAAAYMEVVLGTCDETVCEVLVEHAAMCEVCAQAMAASVRALEGDPSPDEMLALSALETTQPDFQKELSHKLAGSRVSRRPVLPFAGLRRVWLAAAATVVVAAGSGLVWWYRQAGESERLLAQAYQSSRTMKLRIPGAGFAALQAGGRERGAGGDSEDPALFEARARLARGLKRSPEDDRSLALSARADLLEERYDAAIDKLDRLIMKPPVTADLLTDAATAYFQRGLVTGQELDRTVALDYLGRAVRLAPDDPVVLFNEAIVMEDRGQLMNAVDVWKHFAAVERDPGWAAEGKRRLAAVETAADRLKSHAARVSRMLATPETMVALAGDTQKLALWDEELSSIELVRLVDQAFPELGAVSARGSPCEARCWAARKLLDATGRSLKQQHKDSWLADLFPAPLLLTPQFDELPAALQTTYVMAIRRLVEAAREDQTGRGEIGVHLANDARTLFAAVARESGKAPKDERELLRQAGEAGEWRAAGEYLFALQKETDFTGCRAFVESELGKQEAKDASLARVPAAYPWIAGVFGITGKICDDTAQTRKVGDALGAASLRVATDAHYALLTARIQLHLGSGSELAGDQERREEQILGTLRELERGDPPPIRVINTLGSLLYVEHPSPRAYATALWEQEAIRWSQLAGDRHDEVAMRMWQGLEQIRLGAGDEAEVEFRSARELAAKEWPGQSVTDANNIEMRTQIAEALLERGDVSGAGRALQSGAKESDSDAWLVNKRAAVTGQLELEELHYGDAEKVLAEEIQRREEKTPSGEAEPVNDIEEGIAAHDHDLYGELAATWLEEGRPGIDVLALWERFRLRSVGAPVERCGGGQLDCGRVALEEQRQRMGPGLLTGQIVLMDRVLVYEMDGKGVRWSRRLARRQDALNAVKKLEWAVSSPLTSEATAQSMAQGLADLLLPVWRRGLEGKMVLLEADPELRGLAWPVLPTVDGPLGTTLAVAEISSIVGDGAAGLVRGRRGRFQSLVIGASVSGRGYAPLPEAIEEARRVSAYLREPQLLVGSQATAQNVAAALAEATVLHFAGHAVQDDGGTRLLLAAGSGTDGHDRRLLPRAESRAESRVDGLSEARPWIDEAFLRLHPPRVCRLAVLSACATGSDLRGAAGAAEMPMRNLVRTLTSLGVPEVVATRWPVDSAASVPFMQAFYGALDLGEDVAHALLAARQSQYRTGSYTNPYYWAAYYLTGREQNNAEDELHASTIDKNAQGRTREVF